jgi:hypothetical protein
VGLFCFQLLLLTVGEGPVHLVLGRLIQEMLIKNLARFKPGVSQRIHLLLAAVMWTAIGMLLMIRGTFWLMDSGKLWFLVPALVLGCLKSILLLDKTARKSVDRILRLADGTCIGAVFSIKSWGLVVLMMAMGYFLRQSMLPRSLLGLLYVTIGWALLMSSRHAWLCWQQGV